MFPEKNKKKPRNISDLKDRMFGIIGGSSLLHAEMFAGLSPKTVETSHGAVVV
jgi:hypothetical protein